MKHLQFAIMAVLALACGAALAGYPVLSMVPPDVAAALAALGAVPCAAGTFVNKLTNIQPQAAASQTSTLTLACGPNAPTLDALQFTLTGGAFTVANITEVRGFINGREFYKEGTGTVHNARQTYLGLAPVAGELVLDFTEPNARSAIEQNLSALPLSLMQSCKFELDIGAGAVITSLDCRAHFRAPTSNQFIKKQRRLTHAFANAGEQVIYVPNGATGGKLYRIWLHEAAAGNITAVELRARNAVGFEMTRTQLERRQGRFGLTPQAGVVVIDFIPDGNLSGWFDTTNLADVELRVTGTAADTYTAYYEWLDPIGRL